MEPLKFHYEKTCRLKNSDIKKLEKRIVKTAKLIDESASRNDYEDEFASINAPFDEEMFKTVMALAKEKREIDCLLVIGIGGSNLGTKAVHEAVIGQIYNERKMPIVHYIDTVDPDKNDRIYKIVEQLLKDEKKVLINCISKSGSTMETIANFRLFLGLLKKYDPEYHKSVVITTEKESKFWFIAEEEGFSALENPKNIGGRYSVLSPVGLFPLAVIGVDIKALLSGAAAMRDRCLDSNLMTNPAALSAAIMYLHNKAKINIYDQFFFSTDLELIGKWYRQLLAESIGKKHDKENKVVHAGITPNVSVGSTDLHSMLQLYMEGPFDKHTCFVTLSKYHNQEILVPEDERYDKLVPDIGNKTYVRLMKSILEGVMIAYRKQKRPYVEVKLYDKSAFSIGQFLQFKELEVIFLGGLLNVDAFDQPGVEIYKTETRNILQGKKK